MALIDVVKWDAAGDELVWKFPNSELSTLTQLIVHQTQWAILFKNGQQLDVFEAGRHTLSTNNIPLLNKLVNLPFGGTSPFAAEVWYVNRAVSLDLKWGTPNPMQLEDPQYGIIVPVSAFGQMGLRVVDPGLLVRSLVGSLRAFNAIAVLQHFKGVLVSQLKVAISSAIVKREIPILQIETELLTLSEAIQQDIAPHFARFGLEIQLFRVMSVTMPDDDPGLLELKKAKATAARRKIEGTNYAQERTFDVMQTSAGNAGMGGTFASIGAGLAVGQAIGQAAAQNIPNMAPPPMAGPPPFGAPPPFGGAPAHQYFVQANGQQHGPVTFEQMRQAVSNGQLTAQTNVWRQGVAAWGPASSVPELASLFAPSPPPFGAPPGMSGPPPFGGTGG